MVDYALFSGTANERLAASIASAMGTRLGKRLISRFPDGEISVQLLEPVRRKQVFILQPTCPPVDPNFLELLAIVDACRRASADSITAIIPYFGYARSDKRNECRGPIMARVAASCLEAVGVDRIVTVDIHCAQAEGFFRIPVDNLSTVGTLCEALRYHVHDAVVVSPDAGRVRTATEFAHRLQTKVVVLHKQRESGSRTSVTHVVGDVCGRKCLIIDDMIATGSTLCEGAQALKAAGADPEIIVAATHGLFLNGSRDKLAQAGIRKILVTDSIPASNAGWPELHLISVAPLITEVLARALGDGAIPATGEAHCE